MSESYSESFKKQKVRYDARRASLVSNPWDFDERTNTRGHNPPEEHNYPYKGFYEIVPTIMKRDNYTCQICGEKGKQGIFYDELLKRKAFLKALLNHQEQHQAHIITQTRTELTQIERKLEEPPTLGLLVHHKDGDKFNNSMENLVTVCNSCHVSHHRRRTKRVSREKAQTDKWRRNYYAQKNALKDAVNKTKKGTSTEKNKLNLARVAN